MFRNRISLFIATFLVIGFFFLALPEKGYSGLSSRMMIWKQSNPDGLTGFIFSGEGFGSSSCDMDGTFVLDDDGFQECRLMPGEYFVQEVNPQGLAITDIDCSGASSFSTTTNSVTVNLEEDEEFLCVFTNTAQFTLNINLAGDGMGNVSAPGIDCGDGGVDCTETYTAGTEVTLIPTPDAVSTFTGFSGDGCTTGMVMMDQDRTCTATFDFLPLILGPIFPAVQNNYNGIPVSNASPTGPVAYVWGFQPGTFTVGGPTCNGIDLGINPVKLLGIINADPDGTAEFIVFLPSNGVFQQAPLLIQAVDIDTCRTSAVVPNLIQNN